MHKKTGAVIQLKKERGVYVMDAAIMGQMSWMDSNGQQIASADQQDADGRGFKGVHGQSSKTERGKRRERGRER